jgi:hypothetical protein
LLEPAIVAARERGWGACLASAAGDLSWSSHDRERNKFSRRDGNPMERH